jgi:hypothetical protein
VDFYLWNEKRIRIEVCLALVPFAPLGLSSLSDPTMQSRCYGGLKRRVGIFCTFSDLLEELLATPNKSARANKLAWGWSAASFGLPKRTAASKHLEWAAPALMGMTCSNPHFIRPNPDRGLLGRESSGSSLNCQHVKNPHLGFHLINALIS